MSKKIECRLPDDLYADLKEYASKEGVTVTDVVITGIQTQLYSQINPKKQECNDKPEPKIMPVKSSGRAKNPEAKPETSKAQETSKALPNGYIPRSAQELREMYKRSFPLQVCIKCQRFNRECIC